jgi:hypothetical protein
MEKSESRGAKVDSPSSDLLCELWVAVACIHVSPSPDSVPTSAGRHVRWRERRAPVRSLIELPVWCISSFSSGDEGQVEERERDCETYAMRCGGGCVCVQALTSVGGSVALGGLAMV